MYALETRISKLEEIEVILEEMKELGVDWNLHSLHVLIRVHLRNKNVTKTLLYIEKLLELEPGLNPFIKLHRDADIHYFSAGNRQTLLNIKLLNPDIVLHILSSLVKGFYSLNLPNDGMFFLETIVFLKLLPDAFTLVGPIIYFGTMKRENELLRCLNILIRNNAPIHPEAFTSIAISLGQCCSSSYEIDKWMQIMCKCDRPPNLPALLAFMYAYKRAKNYNSARTIFEYIIQSNLVLNNRKSQNLTYLTSFHTNIPLLLYIEICRDLIHGLDTNGDESLYISKRLYTTAINMMEKKMLISEITWRRLRSFFCKVNQLELYLHLLFVSMKTVRELIPKYPMDSGCPIYHHEQMPHRPTYLIIHDIHRTGFQNVDQQTNPHILYDIRLTFQLFKRIQHFRHSKSEFFFKLFFEILLYHYKVVCPNFSPMLTLLVKINHHLRKTLLIECNLNNTKFFKLQEWDGKIKSKYML
jgi:hypothetical protein